MTSSQPLDSNSKAFERLNPLIQRWVYQQGWNELRDAQERAVEPILAQDRDVIISAATASGKTEAAFLSILTVLLNQREKNLDISGVKVLYISPLKALINDQYGRLEDLCDDLDVKVHRWHGDVNASHKKQAIADPDGILLITPESLEAMLINRGTIIPKIFAGLSFIVVDELHAFIGSERGAQLESLMHRIEASLNRRVVRVGLSATLGNMLLASEYLRRGEGDQVELIISSSNAPSLSMQLRGYESHPPKELDPKDPRNQVPDPSEESNPDILSNSAEEEIANDLFRVLRQSNNLVFANSRIKVERYADALSQMCEDNNVPNVFYPHHGNLDKNLRVEVEARLKDKSLPTTAICTSTLELGIDIGSVSSIAQVGPPPAVSSLRQRLGRSGRRGSPAILRLYILETELEADSPYYSRLRTQLIQAIAMINLLLSRFNESPNNLSYHYSTLIQQLLSTIAQHGGVSAWQAYRLLCDGRNSPFNNISKEDFLELLKALGKSFESGADYIMQSADGTLLLGKAGERLVSHYSFYTAFATPEEYRLINRGKTIGTYPVEQMILPDSFLIFAGRRWKVKSVDDDKKVIELEVARGGKLPNFGGEAAAVSSEVRAEMLRVYNSIDVPSYLDAKARELLSEGRRGFRLAGLDEEHIIEDGEDTLIFGWVGDNVLDTLALLLMQTGAEVAHEGAYLRLSKATKIDAEALLSWVLNSPIPAPETLAMLVGNKAKEKYDDLLTERLLCLEYARKNIRLEEAIALAKLLVNWQE